MRLTCKLGMVIVFPIKAEEDDKIKDLFKIGKKKKKSEKSRVEIALLEVVAEEDAKLSRQGKSAINELKKLSLQVKQLQQEFLDHGVLTLLKNWLEPLSNINVMKILNDFPIDLEQYDSTEQLKKSGLGKERDRQQDLVQDRIQKLPKVVGASQ